MAKRKFEFREDLFCPKCAGEGMLPRADKAQSGKTRYECKKCGHRTTSTLYSKPQILPEFKIKSIKKKKRFIITSAVNDTELVSGWFKVLKKSAEELDAGLLIIPGVYLNPDLKKRGIDRTYTWPKEILPYVCDADVELSKNLIVRGKTRIRYTATNPLSGLNHAGDARSEIFGHPQIAMEMVPTPKETLPKMLITTGSVSQKRYNGSYTAKKAEFHHSMGALFVEVEGDKFWTTQIRYDGEGFELYDKRYTEGGVEESGEVSGIVYGDVHTRFFKHNHIVERLEEFLKPNEQVFHDVHDHHIGSHHHANDKLFALAKNKEKEFSVREELMMSVKFLEGKIAPVVVDSNHDRHLDQWFNRFRPERDPVNIDLYYELGEMARTSNGEGLFQLFVEKHLDGVVFTDPNKMYMIHDIDCGQHGDKGPNGARGSAKSFAKTGYKTIVGHSHTPRIEKGCYQCGTSSMDMPYAKGYSSWFMMHCIIYANGKRGMLSVVDGKLPPMMRKAV